MKENSPNDSLTKRHKRELIATKYYGEFTIDTNKGPVTFTNVFITIENNKQDDISYHFIWRFAYTNSSSNSMWK